MQPCFTLYFFDIEHHVMINWYQSKQVSADQYYVTTSQFTVFAALCFAYGDY